MYKSKMNSYRIFDPQNSVLGNIGIISILKIRNTEAWRMGLSPFH